MIVSERIKKILVVFLQFFCSFLFVFSLFKIIVCKTSYDFLSIPYIVLLVFSLTFLVFNLFISIKNKSSLSYLYLIIVFPLSFLFLFLQLPNQKPDEPHHFYRAYDVANGNIITNKDENGMSKIEVPIHALELNGNTINTYSKLDNSLKEKTEYDNTISVSSTAAGYNFISYLPNSLGILIGKTLNLNIDITFYLARLMSLLFSVFFGYLCLKLLNGVIGEKVFFIYLFNPVLLQQQTAISGDVLLNALSLLFICYIFRLMFSKSDLKFKDVIILIVTYAICISIKIAYFPMILLIFLIPIKKLLQVSKKNVIPIILLILFSGVFLALSLKNMNYKNEDIYIIDGVNQNEQLINVVKNPVSYLITVSNTLNEKGDYYISSFAGKYLNWGDLTVNSGVYVLFIILLFISPFLDTESKYNLPLKNKLLVLVTLFITINVLFGGVYLQWTPVNANIINGIQGRYFIPILFLPLICMINKKNKVHVNNLWIYVGILLVNISSIYNVVNCFI